MMDEKLIEIFNFIYNQHGFYGVIDEVKDHLFYGSVTDKHNGLYCITTGGWSDDEHLLHALINPLSNFGRKHYVGYLKGGAFYFSNVKYDNDVEIVRIREWRDINNEYR